jgi:hypothetical protein
MNAFTIIGIIVGAIGGWVVCQLRSNHQLNSAMAHMKNALEFQKLLVQQLQLRSAHNTGSQRRVLRRIENRSA